MKAVASFHEGDVIVPLPRDISVERDELLLPDGVVVRHGQDFNATIISNFLVAVKPLSVDEEIVLNFNLAFYDMRKASSADEGCFVEPVVAGFRYLSPEEKQSLYLYADERVRQAAVADGFLPRGSESGIDVVRGHKGNLISVSRHDCEPDSVVFESTGVLLPFPVRSTVEVPGDMHLRLTGGAEFIRHSCLPNMRLEIVGSLLRGIALRPIEEGEKLTFNYICTEWEMTKPFHCSCNVYSCYGVIRGFKYLDREQQEHLLLNCSTAVRDKYRAPLAAGASLTAMAAGAALTLAASGRIVAQHHIPAGTVLLCVESPPSIDGRGVVLDSVRLPHACDASTVLVEGRLVASRALAAGDALTYNLNLLAYRLPAPFPCDCGSEYCRGQVAGLHALAAEEKARLWVCATSTARSEAVADGYEIPCASTLVCVRQRGLMGHVTFAAQNIVRGSRVFHVTGLVLPFPTVYTVHLGSGKHLLVGDGAQCLAHSCQPNTRIVVDPVSGSLDCFATEDIAEGALVSFNYLTTEWDMDEPFTCLCGDARCVGRIAGFRHVPTPLQLRLWPVATAAVRTLYAQTRSAGSVLSALDPDLLDVSGEEGVLCVARELPSGTVLLTCGESPRVVGETVCLSDVAIRHACDATAAYMEGRVVLTRAVPAGAQVTLNLNQLFYRVTPAFPCVCGAVSCAGQVAGFHALPTDLKDELLLCAPYEVRAAAIADGYRNKSISPLVDVRANGDMGQATFAAAPIPAGTRLLHVTGLTIPFPTVYTILLEPGRHLLFAGGAQCLAHDCAPNVRILVDPASRSLDCLALRDIAEGEVISFNYLTTEWSMSTPFRCVCGRPGCFGKIAGFRHLSHLSRQQLWSTATPAVRMLAGSSENWRRLASPQLGTDDRGHVCAARVLHAGTPILTAARVAVARDGHAGGVVVDEVLLRHSCHATAVVLGGRVVLRESLYPGAEVTLDLRCLVYRLDPPLRCECTAARPKSAGSATPVAAPSSSAAHDVVGFAGLTAEQRATCMMGIAPAVLLEATQAEANDTIPSRCALVEVRTSTDPALGHEVFAVANIAAGTRFLRTASLKIPFPTPYTVMLTETHHLLLAGGAQFLSHSCDPNCRLRIDEVGGAVECEALRAITPGERVTYNYNTTEWDIFSSFRCRCGSAGCVFEVRGFKYLTTAQRAALQGQLSPAIRDLAQQYADVQLDGRVLRAEAGTGRLLAAAPTPAERVVMELRYLDIQPTQIGVGHRYVIPHSADRYNCVLIEGRIVTARPLDVGEPLSVNMNYFVYDMTTLFPGGFSKSCMGFKHMDDAEKQRQLYLCEPPVRAQAMRDGWRVRSTQSALEILPNGAMGQAAYAAHDILEGTKLFHCTGLVVPFPTMYTICVGAHRHLLFGDAAECIAHSCDPNVKVVVNAGNDSFDFVAIRPIAKKELVTFNYNTTEWDMNSPFECLCGSPLCGKSCQGFKHLPDADRQRLWPITSEVVKALCEANKA